MSKYKHKIIRLGPDRAARLEQIAQDYGTDDLDKALDHLILDRHSFIEHRKRLARSINRLEVEIDTHKKIIQKFADTMCKHIDRVSPNLIDEIAPMNDIDITNHYFAYDIGYQYDAFRKTRLENETPQQWGARMIRENLIIKHG